MNVCLLFSSLLVLVLISFDVLFGYWYGTQQWRFMGVARSTWVVARGTWASRGTLDPVTSTKYQYVLSSALEPRLPTW